MSLELWIPYFIACVAILAAPGPTVLLVVSYALGHGRSSGLATVPGVALGDFTAMTISLMGAGALLAASASLFTALKLIGAAYLVWLGVKMWRAEPSIEAADNVLPSVSANSMFWRAYVVTALNPKGIVFFVAFVPQFIDPTAPAFVQFAILEATFVILATINVALWAVLAGQLRATFKQAKTLQRVNQVGGSFLIAAGFLTALVRRTS